MKTQAYFEVRIDLYGIEMSERIGTLKIQHKLSWASIFLCRLWNDRRKTGLNVTDAAIKSYFERMLWSLGVV